MKNMILALAFLVGTGSAAFAGNGNGAQTILNKIARKTSLIGKSVETTVTVILQIDENGCVILRKVYNESEEVKALVKDKIEEINFEAQPELAGQTLRYKLKLTVE